MSIKHIKLEVFQGKGINQKSLGIVDGIELSAKTEDELIEEIKELTENKTVDHIVSALNYGLAVKARSHLHRPENKLDNLKKSVVLSLSTSTDKSTTEIAKIIGLSIAEVEKIISEKE